MELQYDQPSVEIALKEIRKKAVFLNCSGRLEGNKAFIDSVLYPYEFAGIVLTND